MDLPADHAVFDKYRILERLGAGGMGTVYVAINVATGMKVALKIINRELEQNREAVRRFIQEARALARAQHKGVVQIYDASQDASGLWIAMELLRGCSLAKRLTHGPLSTDEIESLTTQLLDVLKHVHRAGIVHRDLKPDNIYLAESDAGFQVKLLDFGVAKLSGESLGTHATQDYATIGTINYLAPEQARHAKGVDHRADIYSLGAVLYECLTGRTPYEARSLGDLVARMFSDEKPPLVTVPPEQVRFLDAALACLAISPNGRPQTIDQVAEQLDITVRFSAARLSLVSLPPFAAALRSYWKTALMVPLLGGLATAGLVVREPPARPPPLPLTALRTSASPLPGTLSVMIDSVDGTLYVDGRAIEGAVSPGVVEIPETPGPHRLELRVNGSSVRSAAVHVSSGQSQSIDLRLPVGALPPEQATDPPKRVSASAQAPAPSASSTQPPESPSGSVVAGQEQVFAKLSDAQLSKVVATNRGRLRSCFEGALRATGGRLEHALRVDFDVVVMPSGRVGEIAVSGESFGTMTTCLRNTVRHWQFPRSLSRQQFVFPVIFEAGA